MVERKLNIDKIFVHPKFKFPEVIQVFLTPVEMGYYWRCSEAFFYFQSLFSYYFIQGLFLS
jgi:hypothetical protein